MNPIDTLTGAAILLAFPLFMLGLLAVIAPDGIPLDEMLELPTDTGLPRGIQEEEPVRWRLDLLPPRRDASLSADQSQRRERVFNDATSPRARA